MDIQICQYVMRSYETGTGLDCLDGNPPENIIQYAMSHSFTSDVVNIFLDRQDAIEALRNTPNECKRYGRAFRIKVFAVEVYNAEDDLSFPAKEFITAENIKVA